MSELPKHIWDCINLFKSVGNCDPNVIKMNQKDLNKLIDDARLCNQIVGSDVNQINRVFGIPIKVYDDIEDGNVYVTREPDPTWEEATK